MLSDGEHCHVAEVVLVHRAHPQNLCCRLLHCVGGTRVVDSAVTVLSIPHLEVVSVPASVPCHSTRTALTEQRQDGEVYHQSCHHFHNTSDAVERAVTPGHPGSIKAHHEVHHIRLVNERIKSFVDAVHDLCRFAHDIVHNTHACITDDILVSDEGVPGHHWHVKVARKCLQSCVPDTHIHRCRDNRSHHNEQGICCLRLQFGWKKESSSEPYHNWCKTSPVHRPC